MCWILLREPGHAEGADEAEVDPFARRIHGELVRDNLIMEEETVALRKQIGRQRPCTNGTGPAAARHCRRPVGRRGQVNDRFIYPRPYRAL